MSQTTRRRLLQSGSVAAIAAGLLGAPAPAEAAPPEPPDVLAALCTASHQSAEEWAAWLADWHRKNDELRDRHRAIVDRLAAYVPDDRRTELVIGLDDVSMQMSEHSSTRTYELLVRHLPGLEPTLRLLFHHTVDTWFSQETECGGRYCRDAAW